MVKTPKKKLNKQQIKLLKEWIYGNADGATESKRLFALRAGVGMSSVHGAINGCEISDFIIDKIIKAL